MTDLEEFRVNQLCDQAERINLQAGYFYALMRGRAELNANITYPLEFSGITGECFNFWLRAHQTRVLAKFDHLIAIPFDEERLIGRYRFFALDRNSINGDSFTSEPIWEFTFDAEGKINMREGLFLAPPNGANAESSRNRLALRITAAIHQTLR